MRNQVITHNERLALNAGADSSTKLPVGVTYGEIRLHVKGTYTIGTGALAADFPKNIFRQIKLDRDNSTGIYSLPSLDLYRINYYDQIGIVKATAAAGTFEILLAMNRGRILADAKILPEGHDHPALPVTQLNLTVTWADKTDAFNPVGTATLDSATLTISYDQVIMTPDECVAIYGPKLESYAMPKVSSKQTGNLNVNTELTDSLNIGSANLISRGFLVTLDQANPPAPQNDRVQKYQIQRTLPADQARPEITRYFAESVADDMKFYGIETPLTGVTIVDYGVEVDTSGQGILVEPKEEALKVFLQINNAMILRYISEEFVVKREPVLAGTPIVKGV